jgi:K+-sensing histidine kinase KdpD
MHVRTDHERQKESAPRPWRESLPLRVALPFGAVALALALRMVLVPFTGTGAPYLLFFAAVTFMSLLFGALSGSLTAILSAPIGA